MNTFLQKNAVFSNISLYASFFGANFLLIESILSFNGKSLCSSEACSVVSSFLIIDEAILVLFGSAIFWLLSLLIYISRKYWISGTWYTYIILFGVVCFDSVIIGIQFFTINQICTVCIITALLLIMITLSFSLSNRHYLICMFFVSAWIGSFSATRIVTIPEPSNAYDQMAFLTFKVDERDPHSQSVLIDATIVFSMHCPHCFEIINFLENKFENLNYVNWRFSFIDQDEISLKKITKFTERIKPTSNPFQELKEIKNNNNLDLSKLTLNKNLKTNSIKARSYLSNTGITILPTVIIKEFGGQAKTLVGKTIITNYFDNLINQAKM